MLFTELFEPSNWDMLYGLADERDKYMDKWIAEKAESELQEALDDSVKVPDHDAYRANSASAIGKRISDGTPVTADQYNDLVQKLMTELSSDELTNAVTHAKQKTSRPALLQYLTSLEQSRYKLANMKDAKDSSLDKSDSGHKLDLKLRIIALAMRRSCKFGIDFALKIVSRQKPKLHFILDDIVMKDVVTKAPRELYTGSTGMPYTSSELRYIFRNWHTFLGFAQGQRLLFYENMQTTSAPWVTAPETWLPYAIHRVEKAERANRPISQIAISNFNVHKTSNPAKALDVFFGMKTSDLITDNVND